MLDAIEFPLPGSCYWSIAAPDDCSFYYLTQPQNSKVAQLDYRFNPIRAYSASRSYGPLCYDGREGCFWASAVGNPGALVQLNGRFQEIGQCAQGLGPINLLAYSPYRDSFLAVAGCKSRLYRVYKDPNRAPELLRDYSPMIIQGVYVQDGYIILALREGTKLFLGAARQDGGLVTQKLIPQGGRYQILGIAPRHVNGRLALLARKFPHKDRQQAVRQVILEVPSPVEQAGAGCLEDCPSALCDNGSSKTNFYHCHSSPRAPHTPLKSDFPGEYTRLKELQNMEEQVFRQVKGIKNINTKHYRCSPEGCEYLDPKDIFWNQNSSPRETLNQETVSVPVAANIQELLEAVENASPQGLLDCRYLNQVCGQLGACGNGSSGAGNCPCPPPIPPCPPPIPPCPPHPPRPCNGCNDMIESIALVETALAHILNAEGEKLQAILAKSASTAEILEVNSAVYQVIVGATHLEQVLYDKLYAVCRECRCYNCPCGEHFPCGGNCPCGEHCPCAENHPCNEETPCEEELPCEPVLAPVDLENLRSEEVPEQNSVSKEEQ